MATTVVLFLLCLFGLWLVGLNVYNVIMTAKWRRGKVYYWGVFGIVLGCVIAWQTYKHLLIQLSLWS